MLLKIIIIVLLFAAIVYLMAGLRHLAGNSEQDRRLLQKQLAKRFFLCLLVFLILMIATMKGYLLPHKLS